MIDIHELYHVGTPHEGLTPHSGRYPYGSGDNPFQHQETEFYQRVNALRKEGAVYKDPDTGKVYKGDTAVAKILGMSTTELRARYSISKNYVANAEYKEALRLRNEGKTYAEIATILGKPGESSVRSLLNSDVKTNSNKAIAAADALESLINEKGFIDVGAGVEKELGLSKERKDQALVILEDRGYSKASIGIPQITNPGQRSPTIVVGPKGATQRDMYVARDEGKIYSYKDYIFTQNGGETYETFVRPKALDSKRIYIRYAEDGGKDRDGTIELRRGVKDISLGDSLYSQVRIDVDDKYYLKGMAVYSDNIPAGYDVVFNTNKTKDKPPEKVFKPLKTDKYGEVDWNNPFGALVKANTGDPKHDGQRYYLDDNGEKQLSVINKVRDAGDWDDWNNKTLPAQFLSKQSTELIKRQLDLSYADRKAELDEINSYTNPRIKKYFLDAYASNCDKAAEDLTAAALPRQRYKVILPETTISEKEIYAPTYNNGEKVALIRYPHGGTFEIPILTVNNKNPAAKEKIGSDAVDAVCINSKTAEILSGADFDGDTVMVIPVAGNGKNNKVKITSSDISEFPGLKGFEPKEVYATEAVKTGKFDSNGKEIIKYVNPNTGKEVKIMNNTQNEMGRVTNLIMDMTLKGATNEELARAVRHSMVVIDAEKHKLDYKLSEEVEDIKELKNIYQGRIDPNTGLYRTGASTVITSAKSPTVIPERKGQPYVNQKGKSYYDPTRPEGALIYKSSGRSYVDDKGKTVGATIKVPKMQTVDDARDLVSEFKTPQEMLYADYANEMKALANAARKEMVYTPNQRYSPSARKAYSEEYKTLKAKLDVALKHAPQERLAQVIASSEVKTIKSSNPDLTDGEIKKIKQQSIARARVKVGIRPKDRIIDITDREWEAIQAGAISDNMLRDILNNSDTETLRKRAMPNSSNQISQAKISKMKAMAASGYTIAEIAKALNVSASTVSKKINE